MSTRHVAAVFCHSLKIALVCQCSTRYQTEFTISHGTFSSETGVAEVTFNIAQGGRILLSAFITVQFVGRNVYHLAVTPKNGRTWQRTYTLSSFSHAPPTRTPSLAEEAAHFILGAIEQRLGCHQHKSDLSTDTLKQSGRDRTPSVSGPGKRARKT